MKPIVDPDICTGCELCVDTCPDVFEMNGDKATVKVKVVPPNLEELCRKAVEECPVEAISISPER